MFTHKDIENRSLFVINGLEHHHFKVSNGRLVLEDSRTQKAITKLPFPKILALLVIGHVTITTALIENCNKHGISLVVMKPNFRAVFYYGNMAEANYLLRARQFSKPSGDIEIAKVLVVNKLENQLALLKKCREKTEKIEKAKVQIEGHIAQLAQLSEVRELMGVEGICAKFFFSAYFEFSGWKNRLPRVKQDFLNATLDIGYTLLFNYIDCMLRLFGFDPYMGVYHQLWFRRKSLVCDLMEPFRCIIDHQVRKSLKLGTIGEQDFDFRNNGYYLKPEMSKKYTQLFFEAILAKKPELFKYIQSYYRCFMGKKSSTTYPMYNYE